MVPVTCPYFFNGQEVWHAWVFYKNLFYATCSEKRLVVEANIQQYSIINKELKHYAFLFL